MNYLIFREREGVAACRIVDFMKELFRYSYFKDARVTLEMSLRRLRLANPITVFETYRDFLQENYITDK